MSAAINPNIRAFFAGYLCKEAQRNTKPNYAEIASRAGSKFKGPSGPSGPYSDEAAQDDIAAAATSKYTPNVPAVPPPGPSGPYSDKAVQDDITAAATSKYTPNVPAVPPPAEGASLADVLSKYAPSVAGGAAIGGAGSMLYDKLTGQPANVRKALILAALGGAAGAGLKAYSA